MKYKLNNNESGFSLLEITIVIAIIGLLATAIVTPLAVSIEQGQRSQVEDQFEDIEEALIGYTLSNGQLPCPDCRAGSGDADCTANGNVENDGIEDRDGTGDCAIGPFAGASDVIFGNLPWVTLGVNGTDAWSRTFNYAVDSNFADDPSTPSCVPTDNVSFAICSTADINIMDRSSDCAAGAGNNIALGIPVLVFSEASNLASSCNELDNTDTDDTNFVFTQYTQSADIYYDDLMFWIPRFVLTSYMVKAELLP